VSVCEVDKGCELTIAREIRQQLHRSVIVAVIAMRTVQPAVHQVIDMVKVAVLRLGNLLKRIGAVHSEILGKHHSTSNTHHRRTQG
jgi:hypothetical protein